MDKTIEIDADVTQAIVAEVSKSLDSRFEEMQKSLEVKGEEINKLAGGKNAIEGEVVGKYDTMSKEAFAVAQLHAALSGNRAELTELNTHAIKSLEAAGYVSKSTFMNGTTAADGAVLVPNAELMSDVLNMLPKFSALAGLARVITLTDGSTINVDALTADVIMTEVGTEGGSKAVTKPTLAKTAVSVREFAGIALLTKRLIAQSAIDVYGILRDSFARAIANQREKLLLTDSTSGLLTTSGIVALTEATGNTGVDKITLKMLKSMPFKVPTASAANGVYVFSRLLVGSLAGREDVNGRPVVTITSANGGAYTGTFNGTYPFVVAETLGTSDAVSTVHAAFGDFNQYGIVVRQGQIATAIFDSGSVTDGSSVVHNLIQENKIAVRAEIYENVGYPLPGAFATLKTAAS